MKKGKAALRCICFFVLAAFLLAAINKMLVPDKSTEPGVYSWESYRTLARDSVDVLVVGSSHTYCGFNCAALYENYGIAAFDICASGQQMWNSYYSLREALKTQTPKLIVLEAYLTTYDENYDNGAALNLVGMPLSENRIAAIQASVPAQDRVSYYLPWMRYHGRYDTLSRADFVPNLQEKDCTTDALGNCHLWNTTVSDPQSYENTGETQALYPKVEQYYRACLELAQEQGIPIVVAVLPYVDAQQDMPKLNAAAAVAAEYQVPFINLNEQYDALGLDFSQDMADWAHLNNQGAEKCMAFLGNEWQQTYALPDRRTDAAYAVWARNAAYYDQLKLDDLLTKCQDFGEYCQILAMGGKNFTVVAAVSGSPELGQHAQELRYFGFAPSEQDCISVVEGGSEIYHTEQQASYTLALPQETWMLEGTPQEWKLRSASAEMQPDTLSGVSLYVWDTLSQRLVDTVAFDAQKGWAAVRGDA